MSCIVSECFLCTGDKYCLDVTNKIISQIEYLMPEITIFNLHATLRICLTCENNLNTYAKFKHACVENSQRVEARLKSAQSSDPPPPAASSAIPAARAENTHTAPDITSHNTGVDANINKIVEIYIKQEPTDYEHETDVNNEIFHEEIDIKDETVNMLNDDQIEHNQTSEERNVFKCRLCNKEFIRKNCLKRHVLTHTGEKKFECSICGKLFIRKDQMLKHRKTHTGTKEFECHVCHKFFSESSNLSKHMKIHDGVKDFKCEICGRAFLIKYTLKNHMKTHNADRQMKRKYNRKKLN